MQRSRQQLAAGILEHEAGAALVLDEGEGPNRPRRIQIGAQRVLVFEHLHALGARMLRARHNDQHRGGLRGRSHSRAAADDELTILADRCERILRQVDDSKRLARDHRASLSAQSPAAVR